MLTTDLWNHQSKGLDFLHDNPRGLLAYDMGTGKTLTTLARIAEMPHGSKILILCPLAVIPTWPAEFEKHMDRKAWPYQILACLKGTGARKAEKMEDLFRKARHHSKIVVVNYETARAGMAPALLAQNWDLVVFDESHKLKSATGKSSKFAAKIRAPLRIALTGTPMPHSPLDVFAQARALHLRLYGQSYIRFQCRYAVMKEIRLSKTRVVKTPSGKFIRLEEFKEMFARWAVQVKARDVLDLPADHDVAVPVQLSQGELRAYAAMERDFVAQVRDGTIVAGNALGKLMKLAQMTGGHCLDEDGQILHVGNSKQDALQEILSNLPPDEAVVIFARFRSDINSAHAAAEAAGRESLELSGQENNLEGWKNGEGNVLIVQIASGGAGIDLTRACKAIYYSVSYSMGDYDQSRARILRPGQERTVTYFHLAAQGTIDEKIYSMLGQRRDLIDSILEVFKKVS